MNSTLGECACTKSQLLQDYAAHLQAQEDDFLSYKTQRQTSWTCPAWAGFFTELRHGLGIGGWGYVPNASGGFMGYWLTHTSNDTHYWQIEEDALCFKVRDDNKEGRVERRKKWERLMTEACKKEGIEVASTKRKDGGSMTVLKIDGGSRCWRGDGNIDIAATIARLKKLDQLAQAVNL
jgi:hypothetical protein